MSQRKAHMYTQSETVSSPPPGGGKVHKSKIKIDPIQIAFSQELKRFIGYVDRVQKETEHYIEKIDEESPARLSNTLFDLWNSYCHKLPATYFASKLITTGDYLYKVGEFGVAKQHCYAHYLRILRENTTATNYQDIYFPSGFKSDAVVETCQAIFGNGLCTLQMLQENDPFMNEETTVQALLDVLNDFRTLTQHLIPYERHCWLVFNGTVHMFKIGKLLVDRGYTQRTLQYFVWCCVCMESVIPLMTLKFLTWRGTLYTCVCHCYLDLNQSHTAELFARRGLQKIHQLAKIEEQSMSEATAESEAIFREVTVKLSAIIFKRVVFESRRPKKIIHRPKTRQNLKELQMLPFPRTNSEKLVLEMFEGHAAQLLGILEALSDPSRRICQPAPPPMDQIEGGDVLIDVWGELILAGYELISRADQFSDESLISLARKGSDDIPLSGVIRFIKLAFTYEFSDYYKLVVALALPAIAKRRETTVALFYSHTIELMDALRGVTSNSRRVTRPSTCFAESVHEGVNSPAMSVASGQGSVCVPESNKKGEPMVELVELCEVLLKIKEGRGTLFVDRQSDMLVDAALLLLHKMTEAYSRLISTTSVKQYVVSDNRRRRLFLLNKCHELALWLDLYLIDPLIPGELALKTALLLEGIAGKLDSSVFTKKIQDKKIIAQAHLAEAVILLKESMVALEATRSVKAIVTRPGCDPAVLVVDPSLVKTEGEIAHGITVGDLQLEMICVQQRLRLKILSTSEQRKVFELCNKNTLFLAVTHMQLASLQKKTRQALAESHLKESFHLLQKAWTEERRLCGAIQGTEQHGTVPAPPLLTSRTSTSMTFKPAPYTPPKGSTVKWYRLFGRSSSGSNIKVRLNDRLYPGLAMEVEAGPDSELTVHGLTPYDKYQFAVAAFDAQGKLISGSIGDSSKPILASPPYSTLTAFGHLIQVCHKQSVLDIATSACVVLWNFFVLPHTPSKSDISVPTLNLKHINGASITVIRHLIESILVAVDISIREGALFCDVTCDEGPLKTKQLARLGLCEKLLVAIELSGRINDTHLGTQAIIQTYGLLAPIIHYNIKCYSALKVLLYCHAALTELPGVVKQRKYAGNVQHMTGVITFYLSKTLHQWGESTAATLVSENGHELLSQFDSLYDELSEQSHAITPSNRKRPVKRAEPTVPFRNIRKCNIKDMIQEPGGPPILKSDTLKSFEAHVLRHNAIYPTNSNGDPEFTGQEDFNLLYTAVANMTGVQAQREVYKFRRRSRFLELYVRVLEKALMESRPDLVIDWCGEASAWLTRRNELLIAPRAVGQIKETKTTTTNPKLDMLKSAVLKPGSDVNMIKGRDKGAKPAKKEGAAELLRAVLPDVWRRSYRLQRLRLITYEEMPWRAQLNIILAVSCYKQFKDRLEIKVTTLSDCKESYTAPGEYDELPCDMFVVSDVGSMMYSTEEDQREERGEIPAHLCMEMEQEKTNIMNLCSKKGSTSSVNSRQSKFGLCSDRVVKESRLSYSSYLFTTFQSMTHALVLAHRGSHWSLLQNIAAHMWSTVMDLKMTLKLLSQQTRELLGLTEQTFNDLIMKPMYLMSDFILDFMESVIGSNEDIQDAAMLVGKPEDIDGGSSLHFDKLDDTSFVHVRWAHRYVMETLQVLYHNGQFEKLVDIGMRFNTLTNEVFGDQTFPFVIYGKRKLAERVAEYNEPWHTETSSVSVHSAVTPVQTGDNVSPQVVEALRLVSVPLDHDTDLATLAKVLSVRSHTAVSLQYCRQLLLCYLAGYGKASSKQGSSPVSSFRPGTGAANKLYDKPSDLMVAPLSSVSHGVIISAYEKTIEMLQVKGKSDLVVQAMHELGNVLFHSGNTKGAFKWWCDALDTLLHSQNVIQNWHSYSNNGEVLLNKCQIWGCLLGACIASNISQYIMYHSIDDRIDTCLLSAQMFKALFHASLPHPTSDYLYATYEIGAGFDIPAVIPGVDLLSDQFRCSGSVLVSCLHYVSETLVRHQYALEALPVLTLYHYVAMSLCVNTKHVILARILKVRALCQLSLLSESLQLWCVIAQNEALPPPPASHANNITSKTNVPVYDNSEPLNSINNLKAVECAIKSKLPPVTEEPFTLNMSALAQLAHARLLLAIASVTSVIPDSNASDGTLAHTKYKLCSAAEVMLTQLSKSADKEEAHYTELEVSVASYEVLCGIALQRQLGPTTVALANHGLALLQRAHALGRSEVLSYDELCSKRRLDSLAWLQLRCRVVEGLSLMTTLYGANDCREVCLHTIDEAKVFNACEIHAWLTLKHLILDITVDCVFSVEKTIMNELAKIIVPSCLGSFIGVGTILYTYTRCKAQHDALSRYSKISELLNYQHALCYGGVRDTSQQLYMVPVSAMVILLQSDWRISALNCKIIAGNDVTEILADLEDNLTGILTSHSIDNSIRSELLIRLGGVVRAKWERDGTPEHLVQLINILCDCISCTDYNISVIREAYLEIAFVTSILANTKPDSTKQVALEKRAAWSSIRSAALCNATVNNVKYLEQKHASQGVIGSQILKKLPQFAALELNRDLATKLLSPHTKLSQPVPPVGLSWVKLLSYLETLKRDVQTQGYSGYCPLNSPGLSSRIAQLQDFMSNNMPGWTTSCNPPRISRNITYLTVGRTSSAPSSRDSSAQSTDSVVADVSSEGGVVLQYFRPRIATLYQDDTKDLLMFYAFNYKPIKTSSPMFGANSVSGFEAVSGEKINALHSQCETEYARELILEELRTSQAVHSRHSNTPSGPTPVGGMPGMGSRNSTKASFSPEPYRASDTELETAGAIADFLGLDSDITKEVTEHPDFFCPANISQIENLFSIYTSIPHHNTQLCKWLLSFKKTPLKPEEKPASRPDTRDTLKSK